MVEVKAIDGLIMATQEDYRWREDIFDGWHFYDVSQSVEFIKNGKRVVVLNKQKPWILHDCGITWTASDKIFEKYKLRFLKEYSKLLFPLVSIMIIASSEPKLFKEALKSAIAQEYINKEIIIVDNSRNDSVKKIIEEYKDYSFINYYKNERELDVINNYNKAIKLTKGEYICFLREADTFAKDKINKMMDYFIDDEEISIVTSYSKSIDRSGNEVIENSLNKKLFYNDTILDKESIKKYYLINALNFLGETTIPLFKKEFLDEGRFGYYRGKQYNEISDLVTWIQMSEKGKVIYIPEQLSSLRIQSSPIQKKDFTFVNYSIEVANLLEVLLLESNANEITEQKLIILSEQIIIALDCIEEVDIDRVKLKDLRDVIKILFEMNKKHNRMMTTKIHKTIKVRYNNLPQKIKDSISYVMN